MDMNWVGIVLAAIVNMVVGCFWYSPCCVGKRWLELTKVVPDRKGMWKVFGGAMLLALVMAWVLSLVIDYAGAHGWVSGGVIGLLMWFGFIFTTHFSSVLWERRPLELFYMNAGCMLLTLVLMGAVIGGLS